MRPRCRGKKIRKGGRSTLWQGVKGGKAGRNWKVEMVNCRMSESEDGYRRDRLEGREEGVGDGRVSKEEKKLEERDGKIKKMK